MRIYSSSPERSIYSSSPEHAILSRMPRTVINVIYLILPRLRLMFPAFFFFSSCFPARNVCAFVSPSLCAVSTHSVFFVIINQIFGGDFKLLMLLLCNFISFPLRFKTPPSPFNPITKQYSSTHTHQI